MSRTAPTSYCAIDFGTSNSAVAIPKDGGMQLACLEGTHHTIPTAVFYLADGPANSLDLPRRYGRAATEAYISGAEGRLMRSMKSILGSSLAQHTTDLGTGRGVRYLDVLSGFLQHIRSTAQTQAALPLQRVVLGRPVYFVDDDPARDQAAQASLEEAARLAGFEEVQFQYEPIAAALDYESTIQQEQCVLVADIGGGTSDFSVVRVGPKRAALWDRRADILANHGIHLAGTDFDRQVELHSILSELGYGAWGPARADGSRLRVPSTVYFDLATWHLINTVYGAARVAELRAMRSFYDNPHQHQRLMTVVQDRLGHELAAAAEAAKITVSSGEVAHIDLSLVERGLCAELNAYEAAAILHKDIERIAAAALETVQQSGLQAQAIDAVYYTGGSTGLTLLTEGIGKHFPNARVAKGDRFASVAQGLGLHAQRLTQLHN